MENSVTSEYHKEQLSLLIDYLDREGWSVNMHAPDEARPYDAIIVDILSDQDQSQVLWTIELSYLPIAAEDLTNESILQCFVPIANNFPSFHKNELLEMIVKINTKLPLVGFGFIDEFSLLFYKYNIMVPNAQPEMNGMVISQALAMITYLVSAFTETLMLVATGEKNVADATNEMQFKELFV